MFEPTKIESIVSSLVEERLHGKLLALERIIFGYVGYVYKVTVEVGGKNDTFAIKLTDVYIDQTENEILNNRIYGTSYDDNTSVSETHNLIAKSGIPICELFSFGLPTEKLPYFHQIMSWLEGESVQEFIGSSEHEHMMGLHAIIGDVLGKTHSITRDYDGAVSRKIPFVTPYKNAFFTWLDYQLGETLKVNNKFLNENIEVVKNFITESKAKWQDPKEFVLSHADGLQGMAKFEHEHWTFTGAVDIEDHKFTDQRFALAGYELQSSYNSKEVPQSFWDSYRKHKTIDPTYSMHRNLFQLGMLLAWFDIPYTDAWRGSEEDREKVTKKNEKMINKVVS